MFKLLKRKLIDWCLSKETMSIGDFHKRHSSIEQEIPDFEGKLKFIETASPSETFVETDIGYSKIKQSLKTIKYEIRICFF